MSHESATPYDDGGIRCGERGLAIRRYYPWGTKRIPYTSVGGVSRLPMTGANAVRKWRIWGSGDLVHLAFGQGARSFRAGVNARSRGAGRGKPNRRQGGSAPRARRW
ncbi:hypothetical protein [Streptomyces sp. NBC_00328]|uniref:hypothetical protein n=1 Tax=Streptomyces sp. NBC_00328 TaxID=2903646 RepID=UPI002E2B65EC|nr:hypothetical protein [Streptomyces sp. NBC_00328]